MQLTLYTDYSLRVLLYLSLQEESVTISEISDRYKISRNHLVKIVHNLGRLGYIQTTRGRGGGILLAKPPSEIVLGKLVAQVEPNFHIVECFDGARNACVLTPACSLKKVLADAHRAFMDVLNQYTLADLTTNRRELLALFSDKAVGQLSPGKSRKSKSALK